MSGLWERTTAGQDVKPISTLVEKAAGEMAGKKEELRNRCKKFYFYSSPSFDPNNVVKSLTIPP